MNGEFFFGIEQRQENKKKRVLFNISQGLMNRDLNPKRDISEIILPPLFHVTVLLDKAWFRHEERSGVR